MQALETEEKQVAVTIGIMAYNEAKFLPKTLESILSQSPNVEYEIIISDNASSDETEEVARKFVDLHPNLIRYNRQTRNVGIVQNYNSLVKLSRGQFFILAGAHDLWSDGFVDRLYETISKNPGIALVAPKTILIDEEGKAIDKRIGFVETSSFNLTQRFLSTLINNQNGLYGICDTQMLLKTRLQLEMFGSGAVMISELALIGDIAYEPEAIWYRREVREKESRLKRVKRYRKVLFSKRRLAFLPHWRIPFEYFVIILFKSKISFSDRMVLLFIWPITIVLNFHLLVWDVVDMFTRWFRNSKKDE